MRKCLHVIVVDVVLKTMLSNKEFQFFNFGLFVKSGLEEWGLFDYALKDKTHGK